MLAAAAQTAFFAALRRVAGDVGRDGLVRLGSAYGGWFAPVGRLSKASVVYSVGVGEDVTFDLELIRRTGCTVHAFDPTPRAQAFVARQSGLPPEFRFHPLGLWDRDGEARFFAPRDPSHVSHSIANLQQTDAFFVGAVKRLATVMRELGHPRVDLLKMDIEGAEYAVVRDMLSEGIRPGVVCVELEDPWPFRNVALLARMHAGGYRVASVDGRNVTFLSGPAGGAGP